MVNFFMLSHIEDIYQLDKVYENEKEKLRLFFFNMTKDELNEITSTLSENSGTIIGKLLNDIDVSTKSILRLMQDIEKIKIIKDKN